MGRGELRGGEKKGMGLGADGKRLLYLGTEMGVGTGMGLGQGGGWSCGWAGGVSASTHPISPQTYGSGMRPPPSSLAGPGMPTMNM